MATAARPRTAMERFEQYLRRRNLRMTAERRAVLEVISRRRGHFDAETLLRFLQGRKPPVSRATLYRTLEHLVLAGIVKKHNFGRGQAQFEAVYGRDHHDHMICTECGRVIEFTNEQIEALQDEVCRAHGFTPSSHVMEIFGVCADCGD